MWLQITGKGLLSSNNGSLCLLSCRYRSQRGKEIRIREGEITIERVCFFMVPRSSLLENVKDCARALRRDYTTQISQFLVPSSLPNFPLSFVFSFLFSLSLSSLHDRVTRRVTPPYSSIYYWLRVFTCVI